MVHFEPDEAAAEILEYLVQQNRIPRDPENDLILEHVEAEVALEASERGYSDEQTRTIVRKAVGLVRQKRSG
jgi:energy-coupling factor transporter ATP-binding protein EcfA2